MYTVYRGTKTIKKNGKSKKYEYTQISGPGMVVEIDTQANVYAIKLLRKELRYIANIKREAKEDPLTLY